MDFKLYLAILTICLTVLVALVLLIRNPRSNVTRSFALLITSYALWGIAQAALYAAPTHASASLADQITYVLGIPIAWTFLNFVYHFPFKSNHLNRYILITGGVINLFSLYPVFFQPSIISKIYDQPFTSYSSNLSLSITYFSIYSLGFFTVFIYAYYVLIQKYMNSVAENKIIILHVLYSSLIAVIGGSIVNILLLYFGLFRYQIYGPSFTLIFTITVSYLIFLRPKLR